MEVEIVYNPYRCKTDILIDGKTIANHSKLARYMSEPFSVWCNKILDLVFEETNEEFSLTFISRDLEMEIMEQIANKFEQCQNMVIRNPIIDYDFKKRLSIFDNIINNMNYNNISDMLENELNIYLLGLKEKNFVPVNYLTNSINIYKDISIKQIDDVNSMDKTNLENSILVVYISNENQLYDLYNKLNKYTYDYNFENIVAIYNKDCDIESIKNNTYMRYRKNNVKFIKEENINLCKRTINELFIQNIITPKFNEIVNILNNDKNNNLISIVNMFEPEIRISTERIIECNENSDLKVESFPKGYKLDVDYYIENPDIISVQHNKIIGVNEGRTKLKVFVKDRPYCNQTIDIEVYKKIKVENIELEFENKEFIEGEFIPTQIKFSPQNAENIGELKVISSNQDIIKVDKNNNLNAINAGQCEIVVSVENINRTYNINVKSVVSDIHVDTERINLKVGESYKLNTEIYPKDAIDNECIIYSRDKSIVTVDGNIIRANRFGRTVIIVTTPRNSVQKVIDVDVRSTLYENKKEISWYYIILVFIALGVIVNRIAYMSY
ncbi:MAG: Ig domain-containing protein [Clostridium sp.]